MIYNIYYNQVLNYFHYKDSSYNFAIDVYLPCMLTTHRVFLQEILDIKELYSKSIFLLKIL